MIVIKTDNLSKTYGSESVLDGITLAFHKGDRVGIIGRNGAGKTTLLRLLAGEEEPSGGNVFCNNDLRVGYLKQDKEHLGGNGATANAPRGSDLGLSATASEILRETAKETTILGVMESAYEEASASGAEVFPSEIIGFLRAMAFPDSMHDRPANMLSGGEKSRLDLAAMLLKKPDILLLDEPTNHLDIGTLNWLEQNLSSFAGTIVIVTHDRYFLDRTVNKIVEIEHHTARTYPGSYSAYVTKKKEIRATEIKAYQNTMREIKQQEELIRKFKERGTEKLAKRAASREKRLAHIPVLSKPESELKAIRLKIGEKNSSGYDVLTAENLSKSFGDHHLFKGVSIDLKKGERLCMVGANGIGKTTLLKIILGMLPTDSGFVQKGAGVNIGYYDQEQHFADLDRTVLDEIHSAYRNYTETELRNILAAFLFTGDAVFQTISSLSGGERAKLSLVKMLLSESNTLLFDEPTNHLDIPSREALEDAILEFSGTIIAISHDRYFLSKIPTRMAELTSEGIVNYPGKYDYYIEKKNEKLTGKAYLRTLGNMMDEGDSAQNSAATDLRNSEIERREKKRIEMEARRKERLLSEAEDRIERLEESISEIEKLIAEDESVYTNPELLAENAAQLEKLNADLLETYHEWEDLTQSD
jgi:ATP-binding cassette subfamily F protein 3